ncbi:hypothetical protein [Mycobacterium arosiense]|uniref:hypothetical protein n=1 Tax=Mycobacterium arosiense TaxID=425468 RepID=UPI001FECE2E1|nr:hypothetical protein [Mycobacterium arosiense]
MDVPGLSHETGARASATRRSATTRDRRGRRAHTGAARVESARPGREASRAPAAAPDTADELQADYFVRLLGGRRGLIDQRIDEYERKIGTAEVKGDLDAVANYRRLVRIADQDRRTLDTMIDKLRRRFVRPTPGAVLPQARPVARRPAPAVR